jgi:hypothetical protein
VSVRLTPLTESEADGMIRGLATFPLLDGASVVDARIRLEARDPRPPQGSRPRPAPDRGQV